MAFLRALAYFMQEAVSSLWRSRFINALSIGTMAVSLFVVGSFLVLAHNLSAVVARWSQKVQVTFYLEDGIAPDARARLEQMLRADPAAQSVEAVTREQARDRFKSMFRDLQSLPEDLGENPFPASFEVTLAPGHQDALDVERLVHAYQHSPGVEEVQYDLLWISRLATAVRLVRLVGAFLGGILVAAGVFTISNVIRLTVYARQDELDIMRLVGATPSYVRGPFVVEGMLQGGLGGALSVLLLWGAWRFLLPGALAGSELVGGTVQFLPARVTAAIVLGGMLVGVVGSLVSIGRTKV
jgi:cell division transport system permease protein